MYYALNPLLLLGYSQSKFLLVISYKNVRFPLRFILKPEAFLGDDQEDFEEDDLVEEDLVEEDFGFCIPEEAELDEFEGSISLDSHSYL